MRQGGSNVTCPDGWGDLNGVCSKRFGEEESGRKTWDEAEAHCVSYGGHLASFQSVQELKALAAFCFDGVTTHLGVDCATGLRRSERCIASGPLMQPGPDCPNDWYFTDCTPWTDEMQAEDTRTCCTHISWWHK